MGPYGFPKFPSSKQFTSWLRLAPNNKISLCKIPNNKIPKGSNRLKIALRHVANAIGNLKDTHLSDFFRRVAHRKARANAASATARKLVVILWNIITKKIPHSPPIEYLFLNQKRKLRLVTKIKKSIAKFELKPDDLGFANPSLSARI